MVVQGQTGCKPMVDAIVRLLSFCNQACAMTKRVRLQFADGDQAAMDYLNRIGFFDLLRAASAGVDRQIKKLICQIRDAFF